jgi:hypothetical protein
MVIGRWLERDVADGARRLLSARQNEPVVSAASDAGRARPLTHAPVRE